MFDFIFVCGADSPEHWLEPFEYVLEATGSEKIVKYLEDSFSLLNRFYSHWKDFATVTVSPDFNDSKKFVIKFDPQLEKVSRYVLYLYKTLTFLLRKVEDLIKLF